MKKWEVIYEYLGKQSVEVVESLYYSDTYRIIEKKYPGCIVKSIIEIHS